jgi:hypothetical protein
VNEKKKILITSIITVATVFGINKLTSVSCSQIEVFNGDLLFQALKFLGFTILGVGIWWIGYKFFKRLTFEKNQLILYFIFISLVSTSNIGKKIWKNNFSSSKELIRSICSKSQDDGMIYNANRLSAEEYNYLTNESGWLPRIPLDSKNIEISYYRDDFLGDYSLNIKIELPTGESINSLKYPEWKKNEENKYVFLKGSN